VGNYAAAPTLSASQPSMARLRVVASQIVEFGLALHLEENLFMRAIIV
jgi:hypothetical protein